MENPRTDKPEAGFKPKDYALRLFRFGYDRTEIIRFLKKWYPDKTDNALNIAMTRAAMLREQELSNKK